jgi:hypothetical protein
MAGQGRFPIGRKFLDTIYAFAMRKEDRPDISFLTDGDWNQARAAGRLLRSGKATPEEALRMCNPIGEEDAYSHYVAATSEGIFLFEDSAQGLGEKVGTTMLAPQILGKLQNLENVNVELTPPASGAVHYENERLGVHRYRRLSIDEEKSFWIGLRKTFANAKL